MAVPDRETSRRVLASIDPPEWLVVHAEGVARVAAEAARALQANGVAVDPALVEAAARLHDLDKLETRDNGRHGIVAAERLTALGYPEIAGAVAAHPVRRLLDPERAPHDWASICVSVADRRVSLTFVTIAERLKDMAVRHPDHADDIAATRQAADVLEARLAEAAGLSREALDARLAAAWAGPDQ